MAEIGKLFTNDLHPARHLEVIDRAVKTLLKGGVLLFPTETVYGIGADIRSPEAVRRLSAIKERPARQPLLIHCNAIEQAASYIQRIPDITWLLAKMYLPGPLALILPSSSNAPDFVTGDSGTVGIRVVNNPVFFEIVSRLGAPLAGTSANLHSQPATNDFSAISPEIISRVDFAIDAGKTGSGNASTILDLTKHPPRLLREGDIKRSELEQTLGLKLAP